MNAMARTLMGAAIGIPISCAWANPTGPAVVSGSALISNPSASVLQVVNTPGTILNWQGFSIANGETTRFVQLNAASAILNRVVGASSSDILGRLESNGRVFLINPNGVVFGAGAVVDVAGLIASTRDITNANFLAGNYVFSGAGNGTITLQNGAQILTSTYGPGGQVWLFGKSVTQQAGSTITAPQGQVVLAAGSTLQVGTSGLGNMTFSLTTGGNDTVQSLGTIAAERGAVGLFADFVTHRGSIDAGSGGQVAINATRELRIQGASSTNAPNGSITLRGGSLLEVENDSVINADGAAGRISFESNNLLVYPGGNTHAVGGSVTLNQYQPSQYLPGSWQVIETGSMFQPFDIFIFNSFSVVYRRSDGSYLLRYVVQINSTTNREVHEVVLDPSGSVRSGPTPAGNLGTLRELECIVAALASRVPPLFYEGTLFGITHTGIPAPLSTPLLPISGGGTVKAVSHLLLEFRSPSSTLVATVAPSDLSGGDYLQSATPLPDGTVMVVQRLIDNLAGRGRVFDSTGAATGLTIPIPDIPNLFPYGRAQGAFPRPDGGFTLIGGTIIVAQEILIQNWSKVIAPYTP